MNTLSGKHILLGVTGGIAAYKSAELVRRLREQGAEVRVVMTAAAREFITPLTLQALSGQPVHSDLLDPRAEAAMGHIELARWADALLVAPATADFIARLVQGRADDLLAAVCLACEAPLAVAPAMNRAMWQQPATQDNLVTLRTRQVHVLGPATGSQACGETGPGRMLEPEELARLLDGLFQVGALAGRRVLVTAGPTREAIDPVRYLSNRSSGKMGYAVARAAAEAGARVTLVTGPVALALPEQVEGIQVETAKQMYAAVMEHIADTDIFIAAAAVADYRPQSVAGRKIKKSAAGMTLVLEPNPDILAAVAALPEPPFTLGFAAETDALEANARNKLRAKSLDMIAANVVGPGQGFEVDDNALQVFWDGGEQQFGRTRKTRLARQLVALLAEHYLAKYNKDTVIPLHAQDSA
ncbi:MAG: bifunctional phosphopantothenoylcysteine decarboxylase/phosphopantothenate--cysteine ligase CoaBC [Gammaproteobacteria bacterium]|nr:bifunctional phosphopantothenoylcysteine decarboxylase/phosphopantothenate--cysteine ligase CoaBC [Gammaproteobacteria bacterium]